MGVAKYRSISEVPPLPRCSDEELLSRIRRVLDRAFRLAGPRQTYGVLRFRSMEEANAARDQATIARMRATRRDSE